MPPGLNLVIPVVPSGIAANTITRRPTAEEIATDILLSNRTENQAIAPPLFCETMQVAPAIFLEYSAARVLLENNPELIAKINNRQSLNNQEKIALQRYQQATSKIILLGNQLFQAAYLADQPSPPALCRWQSFIAGISQNQVQITQLSLLIALTSPRLTRPDRELLFPVISGQHQGVTPQLAAGFAHHYRTISTTYRGWGSSPATTGSELFMTILAQHLGPMEFERFQQRIMGENPAAYITALTGPEIGYYQQLPPAELFQSYENLQKDLIQAPPGSALKINLYQKISDLQVIILGRKLSIINHDFSDLIHSLPGLSEQEYQSLFRITALIKYSGYVNTGDYLQAFDYFAQAYLTAPDHLKTSYSGALHWLDTLAVDYGISRGEIDRRLTEVCRRHDCSLAGTGQLNSLVDLRNGGRIEVSPAGLPPEIKEILTGTGYWELVSQNLSKIVLTPEIEEGSGIGAMDAGGTAVPLLRQVEIDVIDRDGSQLPAWQIAAILVHEAAHVAWRKEDLVWQQVVPDERHSYARELAFLQKYEERFGLPFPGSAKRIDFEASLLQSRAAVQTANAILGYQPDDFDPTNRTLPNRQLLLARRLASFDDQELDYYPTNPSPNFLNSRDSLINFIREINPSLSSKSEQLATILWPVIEGKASLEVAAVASQDSIRHVKVYYLTQGNRRELNENEVNDLVELMNSANQMPGKPLQNMRYFALVNSGRIINNVVNQPNKNNIAAYLRAGSPLNLNQLQAWVISTGVDYNVPAIRRKIEPNLPNFLAELGGTVASTPLLNSFNIGDLHDILTRIRSIINDPRQLSAYQKMGKDPKQRPQQRQILALLLNIYRQVSSAAASREERLALVDFTNAYLMNLTTGPVKLTTEYTGVNLINYFYTSSLSLQAQRVSYILPIH
ncbi:MAG: hypothetical protein ABIH56_07665 [Candidatus Margulisiibacteriota bacterium]